MAIQSVAPRAVSLPAVYSELQKLAPFLDCEPMGSPEVEVLYLSGTRCDLSVCVARRDVLRFSAHGESESGPAIIHKSDISIRSWRPKAIAMLILKGAYAIWQQIQDRVNGLEAERERVTARLQQLLPKRSLLATVGDESQCTVNELGKALKRADRILTTVREALAVGFQMDLRDENLSQSDTVSCGRVLFLRVLQDGKKEYRVANYRATYRYGRMRPLLPGESL